VITENKIGRWDGFSKNEPNLSDGYGFTLDYGYGGETVKAHGYGHTPENYEPGHEALIKLLFDCAENLRPPPPPIEAISRITYSNEDFMYDIALSYTNGAYTHVWDVNVYKKPLDYSDPLREFAFYPDREVPIGTRIEEAEAIMAGGGPSVREGERAEYAKFNFEAVSEIRERAANAVTKSWWPGPDVTEYIGVEYNAIKINARHFAYAVLTDDDREWFNEKIPVVLGQPVFFDINKYFG
jgi:hypothetical protein